MFTEAPVSESVGSALLNEIDRVSRKHERWQGYARDLGAHGAGLAPAMFLMTHAIQAAKRAIQSDDPADAIRALENLRGFDNE